jgi:hypothetical protein
MEPNTKLFIEELMKEISGEIQSLRRDMKDGFVEIASNEVITNTCIMEITAAMERREECITALGATSVKRDMSLSAWKPEVESSLSSVQLQLSKLVDTSSPGILTGGATSSRASSGFTTAGP